MTLIPARRRSDPRAREANLALKLFLSAAFAVALALSSAIAQQTPITIRVDASKSIGLLKHLNDVDNGPLCEHGIIDLSGYYNNSTFAMFGCTTRRGVTTTFSMLTTSSPTGTPIRIAPKVTGSQPAISTLRRSPGSTST